MDQTKGKKLLSRETQDVTDRRFRQTELLMSASSTIGNHSDSDDDGEDFLRGRYENQLSRVSLAVPETKAESELVPLSFGKPVVPSNIGVHERGSTEFFSQRKALSVRGWA
jgi:hypothetical protein